MVDRGRFCGNRCSIVFFVARFFVVEQTTSIPECLTWVLCTTWIEMIWKKSFHTYLVNYINFVFQSLKLIAIFFLSELNLKVPQVAALIGCPKMVIYKFLYRNGVHIRDKFSRISSMDLDQIVAGILHENSNLGKLSH